MSEVGQREIRTQRRVIAFFRDTLGYAYLGHWKEREGNSNVEHALLTDWLRRQGHTDKITAKSCPKCSKGAWSITDIVAAAGVTDGSMVVGGSGYPALIVICNNCGYMENYSAVVMGLM